MMSMIIPFWAWIILGLIIGWKIRGYFGNKLSFLGKITKPFKAKKKKRKPPIKRNNDDPAILGESDESDEEDETGVERIKSAAKKGAGLLARPFEYFLGGPDDEEDE